MVHGNAPSFFIVENRLSVCKRTAFEAYATHGAIDNFIDVYETDVFNT